MGERGARLSVHNEFKYGGRYGVALSILAGVDDEGVVRLGETLTPIVDQWQLPEFGIHRLEHPYAGVRPQALVAGEFSYVGIVNPTGSNYVTVVREASAFGSAAGTTIFSLQVNTEANIVASLAANGSGNRRDMRSPPSSQTYFVVGTDVSSGIGLELERRQEITITADLKHLPVILPPGWGAIVTNQIVATGIVASFMFTERLALPREIRG